MEENDKERWDPRTCDIDILLCDQLILPNKLYFVKWLKLDLSDQMKLVPNELILPHPRLARKDIFLKALK